VGTFEQLEATSFTPQQLLDLGVIHKLGDGLKVLANGELTRKVHIEAHCFSKAAEEKIKARRWQCGRDRAEENRDGYGG